MREEFECFLVERLARMPQKLVRGSLHQLSLQAVIQALFSALMNALILRILLLESDVHSLLKNLSHVFQGILYSKDFSQTLELRL